MGVGGGYRVPGGMGNTRASWGISPRAGLQCCWRLYLEEFQKRPDSSGAQERLISGVSGGRCISEESCEGDWMLSPLDSPPVVGGGRSQGVCEEWRPQQRLAPQQAGSNHQRPGLRTSTAAFPPAQWPPCPSHPPLQRLHYGRDIRLFLLKNILFNLTRFRAEVLYTISIFQGRESPARVGGPQL